MLRPLLPAVAYASLSLYLSYSLCVFAFVSLWISLSWIWLLPGLTLTHLPATTACTAACQDVHGICHGSLCLGRMRARPPAAASRQRM